MNAQTRKFLTNAALTISVLVAAYAFCEVVVRFLYKDETILFPRYHTDYQYGRYTIRGIRPNAEYWMTSVDGSWKYVTNDKGFRNTKNFTYDKPANTLRVLSLGDSHTQGYEARQDFTFSAVLERYLNYHSRSAEVINTGVSGFGTAEELALLENEGIKYSPDVVVLGFFANDFEDNLKAGLFALDGNQLVEKKFQHLPGVRIQNVIYSIPPVRWLSENSYFYSLLFNETWSYFKTKLAQEAEYAMPTSTIFSGSRSPSDTGNAAQLTRTGSSNSDPAEYEIALAAALVERMQRFCADHGIRFIFVDIPYMSERFRYRSSVPPELFRRITAARIEYISSDSLLQKYDGVAEMHVPHGDHHISEFVHTLIGTAIGEHLLKAGLRQSSLIAKPPQGADAPHFARVTTK